MTGQRPELLPPPPEPTGRIVLERDNGDIRINGKWYRRIDPDDRPVERRIIAIGFAVIGVVCVAILTGTFLYFVIFGLLNLDGIR